MGYVYDLGLECDGDPVDLTDLQLDCIAAKIFNEFQRNNAAFENTLIRAIRDAISRHNDETDPSALFFRAEDRETKRRTECFLSFHWGDNEVEYRVKGVVTDTPKGLVARGNVLFVKNLPETVALDLIENGKGKSLDTVIDTDLYTDRVIARTEKAKASIAIWLKPEEPKYWAEVEDSE